MLQQLTSTEIAELVGISESSVRQWAKAYELSSKKAGKKRLYDEEAIAAIKRIKMLRDEGAGDRTIRLAVTSRNGCDNLQQYQLDHKSNVSEELKQELIQIIENKDSLAEKYARATYEIGKLEAVNQLLREKLDLLPESSAMAELQSRYKLQQNEIERLQQELEQEKSKSWWRKLFT